VPLLQTLPKDLHPQLAACAQTVEFSVRDQVIKQGDPGNEFFIIKKGEAQVLVDGKEIARLKGGQYFGETALLRNQPRNATIIAATKIEAIKISREQFQDLNLHENLHFAQRKAVGGGANKDVEVKAPTTKTPNERKLMEQALRENKNICTITTLDSKRINDIIDVAWKEVFAEGTQVIQEGDLNADYFYIVQEGSFDVSQVGSGQSAEQVEAQAHSVGRVSTGGSFGELALLYFAPRAATVTATVNSVAWVIDRKNFKEILQRSAEGIVQEHKQHLDNVDILSPLQAEEKEAVAKALSDVFFTKDDIVFRQGDQGDKFYILVDGQVAVVQDNKQTAGLTGTPRKPAIFGERALLNNEPRAATIKVISETAKALALARTTFEMLLGPLKELKERGATGASKLGAVRPGSAVTAKTQHGKILKKDLKIIGLLGCGGFGAVELVEQDTTKDTYALKTLSKGYVVKAGMQKSVVSEKNVQLMCDSPFIVRLYETYSGPRHLYLLLELALGGELYATYNRKGWHGKEFHAQFYAAGVVFAFDHLHERKIVFRDLKPENLLLNGQGHIKLTDMGLAKVVMGKTFTTCGTPDYFAPEMIQSSGHGLSVDWWTLGILIYELLSGHPPFEAATPMQTYQKVQKGIDKVSFPSNCKGTVQTLIKGLCQSTPAMRLPMKVGGSDNIKSHEWYRKFDWKAMEDFTMEPPYKPSVKSPKDLSNFHARKEDRPPDCTYRDDGSGWDADFATST